MRAEEISLAHSDKRVAEAYAFWNAARGENAMPSQADLDLIEIHRLLPNVFIIDYEGDQIFRYRYMGTSIDAHLKTNLTGRTFDEVRKGRVLAEITNFFMHIINQQEMGILTSKLPSETKGTATYTRIGLPIADDHETPNKVFGLLLVENPVRRPLEGPYVFSMKDEEHGIAHAVFGTL